MRTTFAFLLLLTACQQKSRMMQPKCPDGCVQCRADFTCGDCPPTQNVCSGGVVVACNANGTFGATVKTCDDTHNETCMGGQCLGPCDVAAMTHSYIGCDYWPTSTLNPQLNPYFDFAVAVANPLVVGDVTSNLPAEITITIGGDVKYSAVEVQPGDVKVFTLDWVSDVSQNLSPPSSVMVTDGAYHLTSTQPVTVYQFNPLEFERPSVKGTCVDANPIDNNCHSYTNDASILLPSTALRNDYMVIARGGFALTSPNAQGRPSTSSLPGFFTVVGTQDNTVVNITFTAHTPDAINITATKPGDQAKYTIDKGTVLQIINTMDTMPCVATSMDQLLMSTSCDLGPTYDLTGTRITADKPIAVFGGHSCAFVPYDKWACDHLEEQLFPLDTWGQTIAVAQTEPQTQGEVNYFRIVSGTDKNDVTFEPPSVHKSVTLDAGQWIDFPAAGGFVVQGTGRLGVGQYMVGESATMDFGVDVGDPSLGLGVPVEQWRKSYDFLSPDTYTKNTLTVIAPIKIDSMNVTPTFVLDGKPLTTMLTPIGSAGVDIADGNGGKQSIQFGYFYDELSAGAHHITSDHAFGISVSGVASFTSYLYVGGLNLNEVMIQ